MIPVIIPIFNRPEYTKACLYSLYTNDPGIPIFPVIVNNFSRKITVTLVEEWIAKWDEKLYPNIHKPVMITCSRNTGMAGAINFGLTTIQGAEELKPDCICVLHNDTVVTPNWIAEMKKVLFKDEEIAVVSPTTNYANENAFCISELRSKFQEFKPSNKDRLEDSVVLEIINKTYESYGGINKYAESIKSAVPENVYIQDIGSFCMLIKTEMFDTYGKFDEDFWPRTYEDKLWFQNLIFEGYTCHMATRAFVHHFGNITSDGPGFSFPKISEINERKFNEKMEKKISERGLKNESK